MIIDRRTFAALLCAAAVLGPAPDAEARTVSTEEALTELVLGNPDAPVEVIEYASLACPACRAFHEEIYLVLKRDYIDTGKVRFVYRDFPTNTGALAAAMIARCGGPSRHAGMLDIFFDTQPQWGRAENTLDALTQVARMAGMGPGEVDQCLRNADLMNGIQAAARTANEEKGVNATPTLFVAGDMVANALNLDAVRAAIDAALAKAE